jgi:VWFA-related protein
MKRNLIALLLVCGISLSAVAQIPSSRPPGQRRPQRPPSAPISDDDTVRITTNLVQVDAVVTDKDGNPVTDLRPEELEISEDGKPQKITNLSYIALDIAGGFKKSVVKPADKNTPPAPPVHLRPDQVQRTMALVVDDLGLSFESAVFTRRALRKFVDEQMQPNDLVAIIRTGSGIGALQQFTSDKRQLYAAVERVRWNPMGRGGISTFSPITKDPVLTTGTSVGSGADATSTDPARIDAAKEGNVDQFRDDIFAVGTLGAINYIVKGLRELPGRKSIVLISDGFQIHSRTNPAGSERIVTALRRLTDLASRASVVIYTMDARGLETLGFTAADDTGGMKPGEAQKFLSDRRTDFFESQGGMDYLARETGGFAIRNTNDLNGGIRRIIEDQRGYYLIGYRPDDSTFDEFSGARKFHQLSLKVLRPGKYTVRMRNGFFGITDEAARPTQLTPQQQLLGALVSPFGSAGVHLRLTSLFANEAKAGSVMRSMLHVRGRDLTFTEEADGWHRAVFDVLCVTFGDNGIVVDQIGRTHTVRIRGKMYERVLNDGLTYNIVVPVKKPGAYQLRTALRDLASSKVGSATQFVEVPDVKKDRLVLSGLMAKAVPLDTLQSTGSAGAEGADDTVDESDPMASAAVRQFKTGLVLVYGSVIYNAELDKATAKPQLQTQVRLFRDGQEIFVGKQTMVDTNNQLDLKRLAASGAMKLGSDMEPGEYVLQLIVTDLLRKGKSSIATQWIDFEIVK